MLTDDDFTYGGVVYQVERVAQITAGNLIIGLDKTIPSSLKSTLTLNVGNAQFALADATLGQRSGSPQNSQVAWSNSGLSWSIGDTVSLSLTGSSTTTPPPTTTTEYWSSTLAVKAVDYGFGCGYRTGQPNCSTALGDQAVVYHGKLYTVVLVHVAYGDTLQFILDADPVDSDGTRTERARMALNVGDKQFLVKDAMVSYGIAQNNAWTNENAWVLTWTNSGLSWSEGDSVSLSLVTLPVGGL